MLLVSVLGWTLLGIAQCADLETQCIDFTDNQPSLATGTVDANVVNGTGCTTGSLTLVVFRFLDKATDNTVASESAPFDPATLTCNTAWNGNARCVSKDSVSNVFTFEVRFTADQAAHSQQYLTLATNCIPSGGPVSPYSVDYSNCDPIPFAPDPCTGYDCGPGNCTSTGTPLQASCLCDGTYRSGDRCEIDPCDATPCGSGTCAVLATSPHEAVCQCPAGQVATPSGDCSDYTDDSDEIEMLIAICVVLGVLLVIGIIIIMCLLNNRHRCVAGLVCDPPCVQGKTNGTGDSPPSGINPAGNSKGANGTEGNASYTSGR